MASMEDVAAMRRENQQLRDENKELRRAVVELAMKEVSNVLGLPSTKISVRDVLERVVK